MNIGTGYRVHECGTPVRSGDPVVVIDTERGETCSRTLTYHTSWLTFVSLQASLVVVLACFYRETRVRCSTLCSHILELSDSVILLDSVDTEVSSSAPWETAG